MPGKGTLREAVLIAFVQRTQDVEHAKLRALAQIIIDPKQGIEAFNDYLKAAYPHLEVDKNNQKKSHIEAMMAEIKRGPMQVKAQGEVRVRSRLKTKHIERESVPVGPSRDTSSLSRRLGASIPVGGRRGS